MIQHQQHVRRRHSIVTIGTLSIVQNLKGLCIFLWGNKMSFTLPPIPSYDQCMAEANAGRVTARTSNDGHFTIFNYTQETSVTRAWNDVNRWCRGLIFDEHTHEVVAVPFFKFFTMGQMPEVSLEALVARGEPSRVANKEDGSLGIMFWDRYNRLLRVSTRGSLDSEQAVWATRWVNDVHDMEWPAEEFLFDGGLASSGWTYQFEIIYRENRIVVDYNGFEGLVALARIDNVTGQVDYDLGVLPVNWRRVQTFDDLKFREIMELKETVSWQTEGWVLTWSDGLMTKIKGEDYKRVHAIKFAITPNTILNIVKEGRDPLEFIADLPDEFVDDIRETVALIEACYCDILAEFHAVCDDGLAKIGVWSRKELALWCLENVPKKFQTSFFHVVSGRGNEPRKNLIDMVELVDITNCVVG